MIFLKLTSCPRTLENFRSMWTVSYESSVNVQNLAAISDKTLGLNLYIRPRVSFYRQHFLALTLIYSEILVHSHKTSRFDYFNSLNFGIYALKWHWLQNIQNAASRLLTPNAQHTLVRLLTRLTENQINYMPNKNIFASQDLLGTLCFGYKNLPERFVWLSCGLQGMFCFM